jgi:hypothetical protein
VEQSGAGCTVEASSIDCAGPVAAGGLLLSLRFAEAPQMETFQLGGGAASLSGPVALTPRYLSRWTPDRAFRFVATAPTIQPTTSSVTFAGSLVVSGLSLTDARALEEVFVFAIAAMLSIDPSKVISITFSDRDARRRLLDEQSAVVVEFTVAQASDSSILVQAWQETTPAEIDAALRTAAASSVIEGASEALAGVSAVAVGDASVVTKPPTRAPTTSSEGSSSSSSSSSSSPLLLLIVVLVAVLLAVLGFGALCLVRKHLRKVAPDKDARIQVLYPSEFIVQAGPNETDFVIDMKPTVKIAKMLTTDPTVKATKTSDLHVEDLISD